MYIKARNAVLNFSSYPLLLSVLVELWNNTYNLQTALSELWDDILLNPYKVLPDRHFFQHGVTVQICSHLINKSYGLHSLLKTLLVLIKSILKENQSWICLIDKDLGLQPSCQSGYDFWFLVTRSLTAVGLRPLGPHVGQARVLFLQVVRWFAQCTLVCPLLDWLCLKWVK